MATTAREFKTHQNILTTVIHRQAGTLGKGLLEGTMNAIDARSSRVRITLTRERFEIIDDGVGIRTMDEVDKWFETFGTPHEEGDSDFGEFRIGRGQLYSYAKNTWRTGTFEMVVGVRNGAKFGYILQDGLPPIKGTRITGDLYEPLTESQLDVVCREFSELVKYAPAPVTLNGKTVSKPAASQKWDFETDDAYIKLAREGDLKVYNLGVLVRGYSSWTYGCGGTVVSKHRLQLNSARNDIQTSDCKVWRRITKALEEVNLRKVANKSALTKSEREFLSRRWVYDSCVVDNAGVDMPNVKLFSDVTGRNWSLNDLMNQNATLTVATEAQERIGTRLHREGKAFVLSEATLQRFSMDSLDELLDFVNRRQGLNLRENSRSLAELALGCTDIYEVLPDTALTTKQLLVLSVLREKYPKFHKWFESHEKSSGMRTLMGGRSDTALAWTDGSSLIAFVAAELDRAADGGLPGFFQLLMTLLHESCHEELDYESHEHSEVFMTKHHDLIQYKGAKLIKLAQEMATLYLRMAKKGGVAVPEKPSVVRRALVFKTQERAAAFAKAQMNLFS